MSNFNKHLYICSFYRPHVSDKVSLEQLDISLQRAQLTRNSRIIIAGDFNLPDWNWETLTLKTPISYPTQHNKPLDIVNDMGMEQVVKHPTREDNTLDLVITNMPQLIPRVEMLPGLGDHDVVYFEFKTKLSHNIRKPRSVPIYKNANWDNIREDMLKAEVEIRKMAEDPNTTTGMLYTAFEEQLNKSTKENIPEKVLKKRVEYPWITNEIRKLMRRRDRLYRRWKKNKTEKG